ncbi:SH3 domain-containing kinase-binding protein 1-like isoform X4 [Columba livia]
MPSWDAESSESSHSDCPAPVSRQDGRAAPRPCARWVGAAGEPPVLGGRRSPVGREDAAWTSTEVLAASTSFPARSPFPLVSRVQCGAVAAGGAWHSTAPHGLVGSPVPAELLAPVRMEPTRLPPSKRMAPAPPVPAKAKPAPVLASKPSDPQPCALADMERGRSGDPDADGFNVAPVTTAKLSHPTAARPRVPGQRPPSLALGSTGRPCWGDEPHAGLGVPLPSAAPGPPWGAEVPVAPRPEEKLALEDLKAEVRTLHILVDLMRVQHLRDLEDMRLELGQERAKRQALQVSPGHGAAPVSPLPPPLTASPRRQRSSR